MASPSTAGFLPGITPEVIELVIGNVVVWSVIAAFALIKYIFAPQQTAHRAAIRRSRSCSALHDLHNKKQAIDACAEMFERFEERCPDAWRTPMNPGSPRNSPHWWR